MPPLLLLCAAVLVLGSSAERFTFAEYDGPMVQKACCAEIVTETSVIQSLPGNRAYIALNLDKGPDPVHPNGRACTNADKDFV